MNIARKLCSIHQSTLNRNVYREFRFSATRYESSAQTQPQVKEEKFDFEDLNVLERTERRKAKIQPFMKEIFVSVFNRDLLAYPEILNKEESESLGKRLEAINNVFIDTKKSKEDRRNALKATRMYAANISLTRNGLAANITECLRYLEVISSDYELAQEMSEHWVGLQAIEAGLTSEQFSMIADDLISGEHTVTLAIKEKMAERLSQADFRTSAECDGQGIWKVTGEKICRYTGGYIVVLASIEGGRLQAFLVHPKVVGVTNRGEFTTFLNTPATPLDNITEKALAHVLGISRLYAATLCRCHLTSAVKHVIDYVRPRVIGGKPLSDISTIRSSVGEALIDIYASESAEYFTAGLLDGYEEPDTEMEVAMCRNFMANHGLSSMLKLLLIPSVEQEVECEKIFSDMRNLATRGDSLDSLNMFIALTGIHHASRSMAQEVKQIRNPLFHPGFILKKVLADRHQEKDDPKLTLFLAEHLHPSLKQPSEQLEYCVLRMKYATETLMARHGANIAHAHTELSRLAEASTEILVMSAVLARASRAYCIGLRNAENEMKLAACFVEMSRDKVKQLIRAIDDGEYLNLDHFKVQFGRKMLENPTSLVESPTARVFW